jgi:hypothetical protein
MFLPSRATALNQKLLEVVKAEQRSRPICHCPDRRPKPIGADYCDVCTGYAAELAELLKVGR